PPRPATAPTPANSDAWTTPFLAKIRILPTYIDEACAPRFPLEGDKRGEVAEELQSGLARSREGPLNPVAKNRRSRMKIEIMKRSKSKIRSKRRTASAAADVAQSGGYLVLPRRT